MAMWEVQIDEPNGWHGGHKPSGVVVKVRARSIEDVPDKVRKWMRQRGYSENLSVGNIVRLPDEPQPQKPVH